MSGVTDKPKIVVAGGTGMIGSSLCPHLAQQGYDVVVLTRGQPRAAQSGIRYAQWDPETAGAWRHDLERAFAVINLCGEIIAGKRWTNKRKAELLSSRTVPSQALVDAIGTLSTPPEVFLQASGVGYYGTGEDEKTEDSPVGEDFLARLCAEWEAPLHALAVRHVALRLGVVLDATGGALPQMLLPFRLFVGGTIAGGRQWFCWVHVRDVVRAIDFILANQSVHGAANIVAPGGVRNREFADAVGRVMRRPAIFAVPRFVMSLLLGEQATLVCDGQRVKPARLAVSGFKFKFADIESALRDLLAS